MEKNKTAKKYKLIIGIAAGVLLAGLGFSYYNNAMAATVMVKTLSLEKADLTSSVNASGTIMSAVRQNVYSTLNYPVKEILAEEGDAVTAGDVMAVLDQEAGSFDSAGIEVSNAQVAVETERSNLGLCESDLGSKRKQYETNKILYDGGFISRQEYDDYKKAYTDAQLQYEMAGQSYERALNNLESAKLTVEKDLNRIEILAPVDGTVTRVKAQVGEIPSGILFVIEDMEHLYANIDIKEYDVSSVDIGQSAVIRIEGSQSTEITGKVNYIASAAKESQNTSSTNVKYETHINFSGKDTGIRLGMNARAEIELESRDDVFAVYYDSIVRGPNGETAIYIEENGLVKEIPVACGLETETSIEIISEELQAGMNVIVNPKEVTPGDKISAGGV